MNYFLMSLEVMYVYQYVKHIFIIYLSKVMLLSMIVLFVL